VSADSEWNKDGITFLVGQLVGLPAMLLMPGHISYVPHHQIGLLDETIGESIKRPKSEWWFLNPANRDCISLSFSSI
jgi:hypothetical protein